MTVNIMLLDNDSRTQIARPFTQRLFGKDVSNFQPPQLPLLVLQHPLKGFSDPQPKTARPPLPNFQREDQYVLQYSGQILSHILSKEEIRACNLFERQTQVVESMRAILVDWLVEVHYKLKMSPETLFLTVRMLDRFMLQKQIKKNKFQLLGVTCLFIAAKFQETYRVPSLKQLVYLTANTYQKTEIISMQASVLSQCQFNIHSPSINTFLSIFAKMCGLDAKEKALAQFMSELTLLDSQFNRYKSSVIAASAIYIVLGTSNKQNQSLVLMRVLECSESELKLCGSEVSRLVQNAQSKSSTKSLRKKYSCEEYFKMPTNQRAYE